MKSIKSPEFSTNYPTPDSSIQYLFDEQIDVDLSCPKCTNPRTSDRWCNHCESKRFNEGFMNWTSNNAIIDEFIRDTQRKATNKRDYLVWIDYDKIEDVKYLAKGGFGEIYCGIWVEGPNRKWVNIEGKWDLQARTPVALKSLYNSKDWTEDFLNELQAHYKFRNGRVLHCYGVTRDKVSSNYMLVMEFANGGDLRHYLSRNNSLLSWGQKLLILKEIALGLEVIHSMKLIHRDFHSGNILQETSSDGTIKTFVADLGLCRPVNRTLKSISEERDVYGVLSYIAPEILRRTHDYSEASDIYGFGMIMWEVLHDKPPFHNVPHDVLLALEICKGVRPKVERRAPKWYFSLMIKCWDADPSKRPEILEIRKTIQSRYCDERDRDLAAEHLSTGNIDSGFSQTSHPEAIFASRLLNFSNLPDSGDVLDISEYSIYFCDGEQVEDEAIKENDYITRAYDDSPSNHL